MTCRCLFFSLSPPLPSLCSHFVSIFLILQRKNSHAHWIDCLLLFLSLPRARALIFPLVSFFVEQNVHSSVQTIIHLRQTKEHQQQKKESHSPRQISTTHPHTKKNFILPAVLSVDWWHNTLDYPYDHDRYKLDLTTSVTKKKNRTLTGEMNNQMNWNWFYRKLRMLFFFV